MMCGSFEKRRLRFCGQKEYGDFVDEKKMDILRTVGRYSFEYRKKMDILKT